MENLNPNDFTPYVILAVVWGMVVFQIRKGLKTKEMDEYLRRSSEPGLVDSQSTRRTSHHKEPWNFRILFGFYVLIAVLVPVLVLISAL